MKISSSMSTLMISVSLSQHIKHSERFNLNLYLNKNFIFSSQQDIEITQLQELTDSSSADLKNSDSNNKLFCSLHSNLNSNTDSDEKVFDLTQFSKLELNELAQLMSSDSNAELLIDENLSLLNSHLVVKYRNDLVLKLQLNALIQKKNLEYILNIDNSHFSRDN